MLPFCLLSYRFNGARDGAIFVGILARGRNGAVQAGFDWLVNVEIVKPDPPHMAVKAQFMTNWRVGALGAVHAFTRRTANTD